MITVASYKLQVTGLLLVVSCWLLGGCGEGKQAAIINQPSLTDATGTTIPISPTPSRIISLAPSLTQNIYTLDAGDKLIGVTRYCKLPTGENKHRIGNVWEHDVEQVISLKPDLILATKEINKPEPIAKLRSYGLQVFVFAEIKSWEDIKNEFILLGKLLGKDSEAREILTKQQQKLNSIRKNTTTFKVFIQQSEQLHSVGKDTFIDEAITMAGGINIAANALSRWPMLSIETIIKEDPDLIVISTMGGVEQQAREIWLKFPVLKAVKNNKIIIIDADLCCQATPDNFVSLVETLAKMLP